MKIFLKVFQIRSSKFCALGLCIFKICIICRITEQMKYRKTGAQLGRRERKEAPPTFFWKSKKVPWFWNKGPNCVYPWVESSIQNVVLGTSRRKSPKNFRLFLCFWRKVYGSALIPQNLHCPEKILVALLEEAVTKSCSRVKVFLKIAVCKSSCLLKK